MHKASPLHPLTSLRFFAALAIVVGHTLPAIAGIPVDGRYGLGVSFFFVLSGFILTYVYRDFAHHSVGAFYVARFARLWPVHFATFAIVVFAIQPSYLTQPFHSMTALINVLMLHAWLPINGLVFSWNAPSWSISAELWFYLAFPLLATSRRFWLWFLAFTAIAAAIVLLTHIHSSKPFEFNPIHTIMQHPAVRIVEFMAGVAAGRLFISGYRIRANGTLLEIAAMALILVFLLTSRIVGDWITASGYQGGGIWYRQSGCLLVFAFTVFVFAQGEGVVSKLLSWKGFVLLGEISYATYMIHQVIIRLANKHQVEDMIGMPATLTLVVVLTYAFSYLLWCYVETPCRRLITQRSGDNSPVREAPVGPVRDR